MTLDEVIKVLDTIPTIGEQVDALEMAIEALEQQPEWIPVSERLPEDGTEVFVYLFNRPSPYIAWIEDTHWYTEDFEVERDDEPVAWMPLPEPYVPDINDGKSDFNQALSKYKASFNQAEEDTDTKVLDKIRAEIEQITDTMGVSYNQYVSKIDVLQIIDKYKAESEVEE